MIIIEAIMQVISRKQALSLGMNKYFTGKPCKHGHLSERYTKSGTCESCIRGHVASERDSVEILDALANKRDAKTELGVFPIRCYPQDLTHIRNIVLAMAQARFPGLQMHDVIANPNPSGSAGGTALYKFRIHGADIDFVRSVSNVLLTAHGANIAAARAKLLADAKALAEAEAGKLPEWKP